MSRLFSVVQVEVKLSGKMRCRCTQLMLPMLLAVACAFCGCESVNFWRTDEGRRELADLRAERDREVADMTGKPAAPRVGPSLPEAAPRVLPVKQPGAEVPSEVKETRPRPEWVLGGSSSRYPSGRFITGVGSCRKAAGRDYESLMVAENRGRDAIARNIRVRIQSEYTSTAKVVTEMRTGKTEVQQDTTGIADEIRSTADMKLEGAQIVDRWYDDGEKAYWALAAMDRLVVGENILDRMKQLERETAKERDLGKMFGAKGNKFQAVAHYGRARRSSLARLAYRSQLRVMAPSLAQRLPALEDDAELAGLWREAALARQALRMGVLVFVEDDGRSAVSGRYGASFSTVLRKLDLNTVKLPPAAAAGYAALRRLSVRELRQWVGDDANCVLLANLGAQFLNEAKLGETTVYFYQGKGEAVALDLAEGGVMAEAAFEFSPTTHTGKADRRRAKEGALTKAAAQLGELIEKELDAALRGKD